jgi:hypothetical protein
VGGKQFKKLREEATQPPNFSALSKIPDAAAVKILDYYIMLQYQLTEGTNSRIISKKNVKAQPQHRTAWRQNQALVHC